MTDVLQQIANALALGGTYALLALGLAIVYSIVRLINFAHGELMTIGGYALFFSVQAGLPFALCAGVAVAASAGSAVTMERVAFRPLRNASVSTLLLTSFVIALMLQIVFQNAISPRVRGVPVPSWMDGTVEIAGVSMGAVQVLSIGVTVVALVVLTVFLRRSTLGLGMRAAAEDFEVTRLMGIKANRVIAGAFAISGVLAGIAALLWVAQRGSVDPFMGLLPVIKAFIAATIGGLGSLQGAVLGGLVLGAVEVTLQATLPEAVAPYRDALALAIVMLIPLVRPGGLMGQPTTLRD